MMNAGVKWMNGWTNASTETPATEAGLAYMTTLARRNNESSRRCDKQGYSAYRQTDGARNRQIRSKKIVEDKETAWNRTQMVFSCLQESKSNN